MLPSIGIKSTPKGGFGNRLLNYLNVRQIAYRLGAQYFNHNPSDWMRISGIHRPWFGRYLPGKKITLTRQEVHDAAFFDFAQGHLHKGHTILLKPRLLDDTFAHVAVKDSRQFVRNKMSQCSFHRRTRKEGTQVVLHLRGTDFAEWNPDAIHDAGYYIQALERLREKEPAGFRVRVCSDDSDHPAHSELKSFLTAIKADISGDKCEKPFDCDFSAMVDADYLVSSPSTFAITAALLGKPKVLFQRKWVHTQAEQGHYFWRKIEENAVLGLKLEGFI